MSSFSELEPVCCSMFSSDSCFLTCIQICQEAGQVIWYSHLFKNFPQFVVIHTVKGFGIVNKAEIDVFLVLSCFLIIQQMLALWSLVPLPFLNSAWTSGSSLFTYCWSLAWRIWGFPGDSEVKASACNAEELVLITESDPWIPGSGRSPGEGNGNPLQYSCLENPMDRGAWWPTVHGVAKSRKRLSELTLTFTLYLMLWGIQITYKVIKSIIE